jgi:hypothetical protein
MFILPEYRLVTPSYSVKLSRSHGAIMAALLSNYERYVQRSEIENILWGHLENGGPEAADKAICVTLSHIKTKFHSIGIDVAFKGNRWHRQGRAVMASGLEECAPVGCPNNSIRLQAILDKQSPNPARGLPKIKAEKLPPPPLTPKQRLTRDQIRERQLSSNPRHSYVERQRSPGVWTHNARAEASFGDDGPT